MICPACKYEHVETYGARGSKEVIGAKGDFFYTPKDKMRRETYKPYRTIQKTGLIACPSCGNVFIDAIERETEPWFKNNEETPIKE